MTFGRTNTLRVSDLTERFIEAAMEGIPKVLNEHLIDYLKRLGVKNIETIAVEITNALSKRNCSGMANDDVYDFTLKNYGKEETLHLFVSIFAAIAVYYMETKDTSDKCFYEGIGLGANAFLVSLFKKHGVNVRNELTNQDRKTLEDLARIIERVTQSSNSLGGFGKQSGGLGGSSLGLNSNTRSTVSHNSDDISIVSGVTEVSSFGSGGSWGSTMLGANSNVVDSFVSSSAASSFSNRTEETPEQKPTNKQTKSNPIHVLKNTEEFEMIVNSAKWNALNDTAGDDYDNRSIDLDEDLDEDIQLSKKSVPSIKKIDDSDLDDDEEHIMKRAIAARKTYLERENSSQIVCAMYNDETLIELTDSNVANINEVNKFISENATFLDNEQVRIRRASYAYVLKVISMINDSHIRNVLLTRLHNMITHSNIIKMGIEVVFSDIYKTAPGLTEKLIKLVESDKIPDMLVSKERYAEILKRQEVAISNEILNLLTLFPSEEVDGVVTSYVLAIGDKTLLIDIPATSKEIGFNFKPLKANRITQMDSSSLWSIIEKCAGLYDQNIEDGGYTICIATADGKFITGEKSLFADEGILDMFDLSTNAFYERI